jgi:CDP-diacylglycerol--serine O-phosphatidyltransferase
MKKTDKKRVTRFRRRPKLDFYFIPSMFTAGNAVFGFLSIIYTFKGKFFQAALFIFFAAIFDFFDGRIARFLKVASDFGTELDSLCDAISFGVAPAFLVYSWALRGVEPFSIIIASMFMLAGIIRLARFNVIHLNNPSSNQIYTGLPIPMAASSIFSAVLIHPEPISSKTFSLLFGFWVILFAYFMISKIRFRSFKELKMKSKNFLPLLFSSIIILGLVYYTGYTIAIVLYSYLLYNFVRLVLLKKKSVKSEEYEFETNKS